MINIIAIAMGGAFGATMRYLLSNYIKHNSFITNLISPYAATPIVNALGCFCFALLLNRYQNIAHSSTLDFFIFTGVLASFTTFSTFCYEIFDIYQKFGQLYAIYYLAISLAISLLFFALGLTVNISG